MIARITIALIMVVTMMTITGAAPTADHAITVTTTVLTTLAAPTTLKKLTFLGGISLFPATNPFYLHSKLESPSLSTVQDDSPPCRLITVLPLSSRKTALPLSSVQSHSKCLSE